MRWRILNFERQDISLFLLFAQDDNRVDMRGPTRRDEGGDECNDRQYGCDSAESYGIGRADTIQRGLESSSGRERGNDSDCETNAGEREALADYKCRYPEVTGAERHAQSDFATALRYRVGEHPVQAHRSKQERKCSEGTKQSH